MLATYTENKQISVSDHIGKTISDDLRTDIWKVKDNIKVSGLKIIFNTSGYGQSISHKWKSQKRKAW